MIAVPITLREAASFVAQHHRHHRPPRGHKFSIGAADSSGAEILGVVIVGRPLSRNLDSGWTAEVLRLCSLGGGNVCSFLYGRAWAASKAMGYLRLITYTLPSEGGGSLRGAGWTLIGERGGGEWSRKDRPRVDSHPKQKKFLWEKQTSE